MLGSARSVLIQKPRVVLPAAIASYNFSEGSGTTTADISGNGHTLTLNSATWATGHTGIGLTNSSTGQGANVSLTGPTAAITMMAWVKPLSLTAGATKVALGIFDTGGNSDVVIYTERGDFGTADVLQCDIRIGGSLKALYGPALTIGSWLHVAITFNGSLATLYLNGTAYATNSTSGALSTGDRLTVAGTDPVNAYGSSVTVDDVRLFSSALTATEVAAAMSTPVS